MKRKLDSRTTKSKKSSKSKFRFSSSQLSLSRSKESITAFLSVEKRGLISKKQAIISVSSQATSPCSPPETSSPGYTLYFRRSLAIMDMLPPGQPPNPEPYTPGIARCPDFFLACTKVPRPGDNPSNTWDPSLPRVSFYFSVDLKFEQQWLLMRQKFGDLSSSSSLAPGEQVTLEFLTSQRTSLDRQTLDSTEEMNSIENTTNDKEIVNVVRASSKTDNWNASVNGGIDLGYFNLGGTGGSSGSTTESLNNTQEHISDVTKKSAQSIKTMHKIEVRGITETLVQNRMTRTVKNPYRDRTLSINVFHLLKEFEVTTKPLEIRPSIIIQIDALEWNENFILSYSDFLRNNLIDPSFNVDFDIIISSLKEIIEPPEIRELIPLCKEALELLFDNPNIFNVYEIYADANLPPRNFDQNKTRDSLDASNPAMSGSSVENQYNYTGLAAALENEVGKFYTILRFYQVLYDKFSNENRLDAMSVSLAFTLRTIIVENWDGIEDAAKINKLLYSNRFTEVFRRLSGYNAFFRAFLDWRMDNAKAYWTALAERDKTRPIVNRLLQHLKCNMNYYVQQFLEYISIRTNRQSIKDFIDQVIDSTSRVDNLFPIEIRYKFDVDRAFIEGQRIVIPAFSPYEPNANGDIIIPRFPQKPEKIPWSSLIPTVDLIELPVSDSIHLEAVPGACVLTSVPDEPTPTPSIVFKCDCDCAKQQKNQTDSSQTNTNQ